MRIPLTNIPLPLPRSFEFPLSTFQFLILHWTVVTFKSRGQRPLRDQLLFGRRAFDLPTPTWDYPTMTLIADGKKRVTLPKPVQPGDAFDCVQEGKRFVLVRLERPAPAISARAALRHRKGRHPVIVGGPRIKAAQLKQIISEVFP